MKKNKFKSILLGLLVLASISSLAYLNLNKVKYNTPVLSQPRLDDFNQDQVRLPDVHILETATDVVRKILPGS